MLSNRPNLILGMGGYASFPICVAASILKIKFIIYENNLIIGKANRYLFPFAKKIFVSYKELEGIQEKDKKKVIEVGNIIREEIINFTSQNIAKNNTSFLNILVLGGSQGARVFAEKLPQVFKKMQKNGMPFKVFQQCQLNQAEALSNFYKNENINFEIFNFTNKITNYYSKANLVITRSGASALGELINVNIPFIAIPLPSSADDHQFKNAKYYEKKGLCYLLEEKNISDHLYKLIYSIYEDNMKILRIILNQSQYSDKDIFKEVNTNIEKIINEKN
jgi:UDP-N-acetylglucosamine--N-acetylmuramyl-(pentapeptide) pyrophosphoryl-undecaprenol N-acetylglucosamine transferase